LTVEIEVYQQEIEKLKTELAALQQPTKPSPAHLPPAELKAAFIAT